MSQSAKNTNISSGKKKIIFQYSSHKKIITRDWKEEEENNKINGKISKPCSSHHKKSVTFCKEVEEIPCSTIKKNTKNLSSDKISHLSTVLKSCKEHIKTPYSKKRKNESDDSEEHSQKNKENLSLNKIPFPSSPDFKTEEKEIKLSEKESKNENIKDNHEVLLEKDSN